MFVNVFLFTVEIVYPVVMPSALDFLCIERIRRLCSALWPDFFIHNAAARPNKFTAAREDLSASTGLC